MDPKDVGRAIALEKVMWLCRSEETAARTNIYVWYLLRGPSAQHHHLRHLGDGHSRIYQVLGAFELGARLETGGGGAEAGIERQSQQQPSNMGGFDNIETLSGGEAQ